MTRIENDGPHRLVVRKGPGFLLVLGLPILLAGAVAASTPLWCDFAFMQEDAASGPILFVCLGAALLIGGAACVFQNTRVTIDKGEGRVSLFKGALGIGARKSARLDAYDCVTVRAGKAAMRGSLERTGKTLNSLPIFYSVYRAYLFRDTGPPFILEESRSLESAREVAQAVAGFAGMEIQHLE
jgi:hypothetical protein